MKILQDNTTVGTSLACSSALTLLPFCKEYERSSESLIRKEGQGTLSGLLSSHDVGMAFCSPDRLLKNSDFELALPVGEVITGPSNLAFLSIENCAEFKGKLATRLRDLKDIFQQANIGKSDDLRSASQYIWDASKTLAEPRFRHVPYLNLNGGCGSYATLARILYRLLFGNSAYETNEMMQGGSGSMQGVDLELRQGNEALLKRSNFNSVIDLVDIWSELTQMSFVASVLQKSKRNPTPLSKQAVVKAAELAQAKMKVEPSGYLPDIAPMNGQSQKVDLANVWKHVNYRLVSEDFRSLMFYLHLARPLVKKAMDDAAFKIKMIRWQERDAASMS